MGSNSNTYEFKIDARLVLNDQEEVILTEGIKSITTLYNYDNYNIPIIYIGVNLQSDLYDKMVKYQEEAYITLIISKYESNSHTAIDLNYIKDRFTYTMTTDANYNKELDEFDSSGDNISQRYKKGYAGLIKIDTTNDNKQVINDIIKKSNMASIIHKYTKHMKMVMEPLHVDKEFDTLIIPPIDSVAKLLSFLNKQSSFYRNGYRYFVDFDKTYLLSQEGNPVDDGELSFDSMVINVLETTDDASKVSGMRTDRSNNVYIMNIDAMNTNMEIKKSNDKVYNKIMIVTSDGVVREESLDIPRTKDSSDKLRIEKIQSDNADYIDYMKHTVEDSTVILHITKTEIDSSTITPNKEYLVNNYNAFKEYDGRYVLSYKKEVFLNKDGTFISSVLFGLRRVKGTVHKEGEY